MDTVKELMKIFGISDDYLDFNAQYKKNDIKSGGINLTNEGRAILATAAQDFKKNRNAQQQRRLPVDDRLMLSDVNLRFKDGPVRNVTYNMSDSSLTVDKSTGESIRYEGVPPSTVAAWERAQDKTSFYYDVIKKNFFGRTLSAKDKTVLMLPQSSERLALPAGRAEGLESFTLSLPPSSTIQTAIYYPGREYLRVSFKNGGSYSYDDVPKNIIQKWAEAPSAGSFFYYNIRTSFKYQKI